jgi:hypothetical protein
MIGLGMAMITGAGYAIARFIQRLGLRTERV